MKNLFLLILLLSFNLFLLQTIDFSRVKYIDSSSRMDPSTQNFLFRGNEPTEKVNGTLVFAWGKDLKESK